MDLGPPFVILMSADLFELVREDLYTKFPNLDREGMLPDGSALALEVR